jgi:Protein of unknown function (DUF1549)
MKINCCLILILISTMLPLKLDAANEIETRSAAVVSRLVVYPSRISFDHRYDLQEVIVQWHLSDGSTQDVSDLVQKEIVEPQIAQLKQGFVEPLADGRTELKIEYQGMVCRVPIEVSRFNEPVELRFRNDVLPVLTRAGCNTGKCHGSASGKDGFRLSLFGYDPAGDRYRITREISGRRINLASPDESLLITKAIGQVKHTGGQCVDPEGTHYRTLVSWIAAGALADPVETPVPIRIEVFPQRAVFAQKMSEQRLLVMAYYSDGTDRDVTDLAVFISNNDSAAKVSSDGVVTATGNGTAFIMARFDQFTQGTSIVVRPGTNFTFPEIRAYNEIDEFVHANWRDMHLLPSDVCSDDVYLRRVFLDLIGLLPTPAERRSFVEDQSPNKRERLVDSLIQRDEFLDLWAAAVRSLVAGSSSSGCDNRSDRTRTDPRDRGHIRKTSRELFSNRNHAAIAG